MELVDSRTINLLDYFEEMNNFIHEGRKSGGRVLVHCEAGMSRSATAIIGYILWDKDNGLGVYIT